MSHDRFVMLRSHRTGKEPLSIWDDFAKPIHQHSERQHVTQSECIMLQRVLGDKSKIPGACSVGIFNQGSFYDSSIQPTQVARKFPSNSSTEHFKEHRGCVSLNECKSLAKMLKTTVGSSSLLPSACISLINASKEGKMINVNENLGKIYMAV